MNRIEKEKKTISKMIRLYCRKAEGNEELCGNCRDLMEYAFGRLDNCPYGEYKTACKKCKTHCYSKTRRERIKKIMRFSGPRMLFYYPSDFVRHFLHK